MSLQPPLVADYQVRDRMRLVLALAELREEWQRSSRGSLLKVEAPLGLLLADIADKLELTSQERYVFLGGRLINEVDGYMETKVRRKLSH